MYAVLYALYINILHTYIHTFSVSVSWCDLATASISNAAFSFSSRRRRESSSLAFLRSAANSAFNFSISALSFTSVRSKKYAFVRWR